jgi:two-component system NtrC family response regulator
MATVLVIDDEQSIIWALDRFLTTLGHRVLTAPTAERGLEIAAAEKPDLVICDVKLPGMDGLAALEELKRRDPAARVVVITAHGGFETAVKATKLGAVEYLTKPIDLMKARKVLEDALRAAPASREIEKLRADGSVAGIVGKTAAMQELFQRIAAVCDSDANVLLVGDSGSGKELLARAIHSNGRRASGPFEPINCGSIPEPLLESELYGHEKGAFTGAIRRKPGKFETAHGGTAFLDEVGELSAAMQVKLLRFLEDRSFTRVGGTEQLAVDVRIVSATNQDLETRVGEGRFREDLYFRLNVVKIAVPALRDRRDDIPLLVAHFVERCGAKGVSDEALEILKNHAWPGNVRELKNAIERGAVLARGRIIQPDHLPDSVLRPRPFGRPDLDGRIGELVDEAIAAPDAPPGGLLRHVEAKWERALLRRALERCGGNQVKASELLGINRMTLRRKIELYGL